MENYVFVRNLGSGHFGETRLYCNKLTGGMEAIKFIKRGENITKNVLGEVINLMKLDHPNVIGFNHVFITRDHFCISMEYANCGDLYNTVSKEGSLEEDDANYYFTQLIKGVEYCHENNIIHRDIKLENVLINSSDDGVSVKLCDFGFSESVEGIHKSIVGTPAYIAPEILEKNADGYDGKKSDVWACGIMLYVMVYGCYPFEDPSDPTNIMKTLRNVILGDYHFPPHMRVSHQLRDTIEQIKNHPWFKDQPYDDPMSGNNAKSTHVSHYSQTPDEVHKIFELAQSVYTEEEEDFTIGTSISEVEQKLTDLIITPPEIQKMCMPRTVCNEISVL